MGLAGGGLLATPFAASVRGADSTKPAVKYPAPRNPDSNSGWKLTDEKVAGSYNNFYEFSLGKEIPPQLTAKFTTAPWLLEITGLIEKPLNRM